MGKSKKTKLVVIYIVSFLIIFLLSPFRFVDTKSNSYKIGWFGGYSYLKQEIPVLLDPSCNCAFEVSDYDFGVVDSIWYIVATSALASLFVLSVSYYLIYKKNAGKDN